MAPVYGTEGGTLLLRQVECGIRLRNPRAVYSASLELASLVGGFHCLLGVAVSVSDRLRHSPLVRFGGSPRQSLKPVKYSLEQFQTLNRRTPDQ